MDKSWPYIMAKKRAAEAESDAGNFRMRLTECEKKNKLLEEEIRKLKMENLRLREQLKGKV